MTHADVIKNIYENVSRGDFQPLLDSLAPSVEWNEAENIPYSPGHAFVGPSAIQELVFARLADDFAVFEVVVGRIVDGGSVIVVEGRYVGTTNLGAELDAAFAHVWEFDDTHCVRFQQYSDTWQWRKVLGSDA